VSAWGVTPDGRLAAWQRAVIAVIFEVWLATGRKDNDLRLAGQLREKLERRGRRVA
jgi:hypothetical protein